MSEPHDLIAGDYPVKSSEELRAQGELAAMDDDAGSGPSQVRNQILKKAREELPDFLNVQLSKINDKDLSLPAKLDTLAETLSAIVPLQIGESLAKVPSEARSVALSRAMAGLREITNVLKTKRDVENSDEINPYSPKFQIVFGWFFDVFHHTLTEQGLDEIAINNIFAKLSVELVGWEEKIEKRLRGVAGRALENLTNPLIKDFKDSIRAQTNAANISTNSDVS